MFGERGVDVIDVGLMVPAMVQAKRGLVDDGFQIGIAEAQGRQGVRTDGGGGMFAQGLLR